MKRAFGPLLVLVIIVGLGVGAGIGYARGSAKSTPTAAASSSTSGSSQRSVNSSGTSQAGASPSGAQSSGTPEASGTPRAGGGGFQRGQAGGTPTAGGGQRAGSTTAGVVESVDGDTITLRTANGSVKVKVSSDTTVRKVVTGTLSDVTAGETVTVTGQAGADGVIAATSVQTLPADVRGGQ